MSIASMVVDGLMNPYSGEFYGLPSQRDEREFEARRRQMKYHCSRCGMTADGVTRKPFRFATPAERRASRDARLDASALAARVQERQRRRVERRQERRAERQRAREEDSDSREFGMGLGMMMMRDADSDDGDDGDGDGDSDGDADEDGSEGEDNDGYSSYASEEDEKSVCSNVDANTGIATNSNNPPDFIYRCGVCCGSHCFHCPGEKCIACHKRVPCIDAERNMITGERRHGASYRHYPDGTTVPAIGSSKSPYAAYCDECIDYSGCTACGGYAPKGGPDLEQCRDCPFRASKKGCRCAEKMPECVVCGKPHLEVLQMEKRYELKADRPYGVAYDQTGTFLKPGFCSKHFDRDHRKFDPALSALHIFLLGVSQAGGKGGRGWSRYGSSVAGDVDLLKLKGTSGSEGENQHQVQNPESKRRRVAVSPLTKLAGLPEVVQLIWSFIGDNRARYYYIDPEGKKPNQERTRTFFSLSLDVAPISLDHKDYVICQDCGDLHCKSCPHNCSDGGGIAQPGHGRELQDTTGRVSVSIRSQPFSLQIPGDAAGVALPHAFAYPLSRSRVCSFKKTDGRGYGPHRGAQPPQGAIWVLQLPGLELGYAPEVANTGPFSRGSEGAYPSYCGGTVNFSSPSCDHFLWFGKKKLWILNAAAADPRQWRWSQFPWPNLESTSTAATGTSTSEMDSVRFLSDSDAKSGGKTGLLRTILKRSLMEDLNALAGFHIADSACVGEWLFVCEDSSYCYPETKKKIIAFVLAYDLVDPTHQGMSNDQSHTNNNKQTPKPRIIEVCDETGIGPRSLQHCFCQKDSILSSHSGLEPQWGTCNQSLFFRVGNGNTNSIPKSETLMISWVSRDSVVLFELVKTDWSYCIRRGPEVDIDKTVTFPVESGPSSRRCETGSFLSLAYMKNRGLFALYSPTFRRASSVIHLPMTIRERTDTESGGVSISSPIVSQTRKATPSSSNTSNPDTSNPSTPNLAWSIVASGLKTCRQTPLIPFTSKRSFDRLIVPGGLGFHPDSSDDGEQLITAHVVHLRSRA